MRDLSRLLAQLLGSLVTRDRARLAAASKKLR
jgi:hypothetical protein